MFSIVVTLGALGLLTSSIFASPADFGVSVENPEKYPFAVRVTVQTVNVHTKKVFVSECGGILFTTSIVLTAAHCLIDEEEKVTSVTVTAGDAMLGSSSSMKQEVAAKGFRIHKDYTNENFKFKGPNEFQVNDIAILWMVEKFHETNTLKTAKLSAATIANDIVGIGLGFGNRNVQPKEHELQEVKLKLVSYDTCRYVLKYNNGPNTFCAFSTDGKSINTKGDSGSGLVYNGEVLGLLSFGPKSKTDKRKPLSYTHIAKYTEFLKTNMKGGPPTKLCSKPKGKFCALSNLQNSQKKDLKKQ